MILEKEINELFELSKKAIEKKTAWAVDFTIGATGPLCGVMIKETPEIEAAFYCIYRNEDFMETSLKNCTAAKEHLLRLLEGKANEKA